MDSRHIGRFVMLTGIKVQITAESSIVIGGLSCYLHFCPGQNDKLPEVRPDHFVPRNTQPGPHHSRVHL